MESLINRRLSDKIFDKFIPLPTYKDINHKDIMSFYVKECVVDKKIRILRNYDYMDKFITAVKELDLDDEYKMVTDDFYRQIADEWVHKNNIKF